MRISVTMDVDAALDDAYAHQQAGRFAEALALYQQVLAVDPALAEAQGGVLVAQAGLALHQRRYDAAIALCTEALDLQSYDLTALAVRGEAQARAGHMAAAIADAERALVFDPDFAQALYVRGLAQVATHPAAALVDLERAAELNPALPFVAGEAIVLAMQTCSWEGLAEKTARLLTHVTAHEPVVRPFWVLSMPSTAAQQRDAAASYARAVVPPMLASVPAFPKDAAKIRLGYFSADFCAHPTTHLITGLLAGHDRTRFEVVAVGLGGSRFDTGRSQVVGAVDRFLDWADLSDADIVAAARKAEIHIALDLNVHTSRQPSIFAHRIAPIQVNSLGYPGTAAMDCYDYLIGDASVTPVGCESDFSEHIAQLPHSYQPTDFARYGSLNLARRDAGLPTEGLVFCCFNDSFKITPAVFEIWMRLLKAVPDSVLWLLGNNPHAVTNLKTEAAKRGVDSARLVFAPRVPIGQHIARHRLADLFLDTWPYNAHTTASDALWAGLPVLTCPGTTFASRVAAGLVTAAGLPDLLARTPDDYEQMALALAREPVRLAALRARLDETRGSSPLFDTTRYTRNIEAAYLAMWDRYVCGLPPDHITITDPAS